MHLHKDTLISSFLGATSEGVLCGEQLRGVRVNLVRSLLRPSDHALQLSPCVRACYLVRNDH